MRTSRKVSNALLMLLAVALVSGCTYDKLPPKTDDATSSYVTPKGELPSEAEIALVEAARAEYEQSITK